MNNKTTYFINQNWQFRRAGSDEWLQALVPGTVHTDLKNHGLIKDPFFRLNENDLQWIEEEDWEYRTVFELDKALLENDVVELIFDGLDTYADVFLNGNLILQADNMFLGWKISCKEHLVAGINELIIFFHSPVKKGLEKLKAFGHKIPAPNELAPEGKRTSPFTRKAPFHYGWDWGPRMVTSGIWRPVRLFAWSFSQIEDVYIVTKSIQNNQAFINVEVEIQVEKTDNYIISLFVNGEEIKSIENHNCTPGKQRATFEIVIDNPRLWWPNGLGEAFLYDFELRLQHDKVIIHKQHKMHGIRTVILVQNPDETGHSFYFEVNNLPVFMKGANVVPPETLTSESNEETYRKLISCAVDANMNMVRVWGGGIYLDDIFYELCSAGGLLVWHDFMFACALQPGDSKHLESIKREAEYNIKKLRNQACIALWCGNNENLTGWHKWGWQEFYNSQTRDEMWKTYQNIFHHILPNAVKEFDFATAYRATTPATVDYRLPDRNSGDEHDWTIWFGQKPVEAFWENVPRFVSEWGLQSFPEIKTIRSFAAESDLFISSEVMRHRQRSRMDWLQPGFDGNQMISWYVEEYFDKPKDFEELVEKSQLMQALACKIAIEAHRTAKPVCMGSLFWQLNDCWPTVSWATVDYFFRWKPAHFAVKNAFAQVIITAREKNDFVQIFVVSDKPQPFNASFRIALTDFEGNSFFEDEMEVVISANTSKMIYENDFSTLLQGDFKRKRLLNLNLFSQSNKIAKNRILFAKPKELMLQTANLNFLKEIIINE